MHTQAGATLSPGALFVPAGFATEPTVSQDLQRCEFSSQETGGLIPNQQHSCSQNSGFTEKSQLLPQKPASASVSFRSLLLHQKSDKTSCVGYKSHEAGLGWPCLSRGIVAGAASVAWRGKRGLSHQGASGGIPITWGGEGGGQPSSGGQHSSDGDPLVTSVSSVHVLQGLRTSKGILKLYYVACRQIQMLSSYRHFLRISHLNFPTGGEYLHDKILHHMLHQLPDMHFVGFQERSLLFFLFHLFQVVCMGSRNTTFWQMCVERDLSGTGAAGSWRCQTDGLAETFPGP